MSDALTLRDKILRSFPNEFVKPIVEFNKYIAANKADYTIFVARKSLRIYDLLTFAGGPPIQGRVLSDHVLDQDLSPFKNKTVQIVDDTVILGTTLGEVVRKLKLADTKHISSCVLAVDSENWCEDLFKPDKYFINLNHDQMLTLCAAEVKAMSLAAIPYLSDFPFSVPLRLTGPRLSLLHSLPSWEAHTLTRPPQEAAGVAMFSFLPRGDADHALKSIFGEAIYNLLEIVKVRAYSLQAGKNYWTRLVPVVTLRPLNEETVAKLFFVILSHLEGSSDITKKPLRKIGSHLTSSTSKLRFVQYVLSMAVARLFHSEFIHTSETHTNLRFSAEEGSRLFGPWLRSEIIHVHRIVPLAFSGDGKVASFHNTSFSEATLPQQVVETSKAEYAEFAKPKSSDSKSNVRDRGIFTDLTRAFVGLHKKYELPARNEARRLGASLFTVPSQQAPYRDRLKFGFAWRALVQSILERGNLTITLRRTNLISLVLDSLIDLGIAVPVLCHRGDVLFRAYRYGEDVSFGDQEIALAFDVAQGFLSGSGRDDIPRIILEKLLTSLIRVGVARDFLDVVQGLTGAEGVARIGFHLHGAIVMFPQQDTVFADDRDSWLSQYMVDEGVLARDPRGLYRLGTRPEAAFLTPRATTEARELGWLIGLLSNSKNAEGRRLLPETDLIVLASCTHPQDAAGAVAAELRLFTRWFERYSRTQLRAVDWNSLEQLTRILAETVQGQGYTAINASLIKIDGYAKEKSSSIVATCSVYLETLQSGQFLAEHWRGVWQSILGIDPSAERERFGPVIGALTEGIIIAFLGILTIELSLHSSISLLSKDQKAEEDYKRACNKVRDFLERADELTLVRDSQAEVFQRLLHIASVGRLMPEPEKGFKFGVSLIKENLRKMHIATQQAEERVIDYGRNSKRFNYKYALWYDIVDSTGQKSGLSGDLLHAYRSRVRLFKQSWNRDLFGLTRDASHASCTVTSWQGRIESTDDEKSIFFSGARSLSWLQKAIEILLTRAQAHELRIRCLAINTDFAGGAAYKFANDPMIWGADFWEYSSRVKNYLKKTEVDLWNSKGKILKSSVVWFGDELVEDLRLPNSVVWMPGLIRATVSTEIEDITVETRVCGGLVSIKKFMKVRGGGQFNKNAPPT